MRSVGAAMAATVQRVTCSSSDEAEVRGQPGTCWSLTSRCVYTMRELGSRNSIRVHVERDKRLARVLRPYKESRHRVFTHSGRAGRYARPLAVVRVESSGVRPSTACSAEGCPPSQVGGHGNESVRNGLRPFRILLIYQYSISNYQITFTSDHYQCTARVCQ